MMYMKKIILFPVLAMCIISAIPADEITAVWSRLYREAVSLEHQYAIMQRIADQDNRNLVPVMDEALEELIAVWENLPTATERSLHRNLVNLIVEELGSLKAARSAPRIYQVMAERDNAFQEALAIRALANMGARDYVDEIAERLRTINMDIIEYSSREEIETVVGSCVYALERLKQPEGYEPVFFASLGGYSSPVMDKIDRALASMIDDPTEILKGILIEYTDPEIKIRALEEAARSQAPPEKIVDVAAEALNQGLTINTENNRQALMLSRLRILAAAVIRDSGIDSPDASALLRIMLTRMYEMNEMLTCIDALGSQKNDVAAKALSDYLQYHNQRPAELRERDDYRLVMATIYAMGNTGNSKVIPFLSQVEFFDWNRDVRRAAEEALEKLEG